MKSPLRLLLLAATFSLTLPATRSNAAQSSSGSPPAALGSGYILNIIDGKFADAKGGTATLSKIADVLRERYEGVDIVMAPEIGKLRINDLKLRSANLPETLEALRVASGYAFQWRQGGAAPSSPTIDPSTGLPVVSAPQSESPLFFLYRAEGETPRRMVEVFNLSGYLERSGKREQKEVAANLDEIRKIISDTLQQVMQGTVGSEGEPSFQFHPGANLLIVIGSPEALDVSRKVVMALPGAAMASDNSARAMVRPQPGSPEANEATMRAFRRRYGLEPDSAARNPETEQKPVAPPSNR